MSVRIDNKTLRSDFLSPTVSLSQEINRLKHCFLCKAKIRLGVWWRQCKYSKSQRNLHYDIV